jgi:hypothetical protein
MPLSYSITTRLLTGLQQARDVLVPAFFQSRPNGSGFLIRRGLFTRTGIHPRIESEGMLRWKTL